MTPWIFPKLSVKFFYSFLLINFAAKLIDLYLLTYEQMTNKRVCKSRKSTWESIHQLLDINFFKTE